MVVLCHTRISIMDLKTVSYQIQQIRKLERLAIEHYGISASVLMERAGHFAFKILKSKWPQAQHILVLCGKGNNGGDAYILARIAKQQGLNVSVRQIGAPEERADTAKAAALACAKANVHIKPFAREENIKADVIVDGLLGIG